MMMPTRYTQRAQRGTTLLEVLIAALIIAIGLLGIASLQVKALQASSNAEYRSKATDIAWELADRMRANLPSNTAAGDAYISTAALANNYCTSNPAPPSACAMTPGSGSALGVSRCSPADMAAFDLHEARCASTGAKKVLPEGKLTVSCNDRVGGNPDPCDPGSEMLITVSWATRTETLDTGNQTDFITLAVIPGSDPDK